MNDSSEGEQFGEPPRKRSRRGNETDVRTPGFLTGNVMSTLVSNDRASYKDKEIWVVQLPRDVRSLHCCCFS